MASLAVFASGRGSNFLAIHDAVQAGAIDADIALVFSNKEDAPGLAAARARGLDTLFINPKLYPEKPEYDKEILREAGKRRIDLVVLAGYMKIVTPGFCEAYKHRIINIHPALLPAFPGLHVQQRAIEHGVRFSGCTTHFVSAEVDAGPIILQAAVPVEQDDTPQSLSDRILEEEHRIYPEAVRLFFQDRLRIEGRRVRILPPVSGE